LNVRKEKFKELPKAKRIKNVQKFMKRKESEKP